MVKNEAFANSVTNMAFNLTLSKNMVICLACTAGVADIYSRDIFTAFGSYDTAVTSRQALRKRGLIQKMRGQEKEGIYELTEAGKHIFELLKIAGLVQKIEIANEINQPKKEVVK